jgi:hypothetical protein
MGEEAGAKMVTELFGILISNKPLLKVVDGCIGLYGQEEACGCSVLQGGEQGLRGDSCRLISVAWS